MIDYAQPLAEFPEPGFTFMNGPGNDLEGIAGQVGAGCNLIIFVTGNGSVTNFPFVPTLKITTTTRRHNLLIQEMDINAGRYLDGEPMASLASDAFELVISTASGRKTKGEHAGHSQVSLWRNWRQTDTSHLAELRARTAPNGKPLPLVDRDTRAAAQSRKPTVELNVFRANRDRFATERVGLVLPTSLCATQIARLAVARLNAKHLGAAQGISRFVTFTHTEGCGFGGQSMYELLQRTYRGYLIHPNVAAALLLEHGCEKVPNDVMRHQLDLAGVPLNQFGWASVQLDGGMEKALAKIERWFEDKLASLPPAITTTADLGALAVGFMTAAPVTAPTAIALAAIVRSIVIAGGSALIPESDPLLANLAFVAPLFGQVSPHATLIYGQPFEEPGLHVIDTETSYWMKISLGSADAVHIWRSPSSANTPSRGTRYCL